MREREELAGQAYVDSLTGLYNRTGFSVAVEKLRHDSHNDMVEGLFSVDMDKFKNINDTSGHKAGDTVLKLFAQTAQSIFSENAVLGRWGGDEFVILAHDEESQVLEEKANELRKQMNVEFNWENNTHLLSVSIGGCIAEKGMDIEKLFMCSDEILYAVKEGGRNNCLVKSFEPKT